MFGKRELTALFLTQAGIDTSELNIKTHMQQLWATPYSPIGYRLSSEGNHFLHDILKLKRYTYKVKVDTTRSLKLYLQLNQNIQYPYYLQGQNSIVLYGEQEAMMIALMDGDIQQYMNNFCRS
jgi:hypothetical protein